MKILKIKKEQFHWSDACRAMITFGIPYNWVSTIYFNDYEEVVDKLSDRGFSTKNILVVDFGKIRYTGFTNSTFYEHMVLENMTKKKFLSTLDRCKKTQAFV